MDVFRFIILFIFLFKVSVDGDFISFKTSTRTGKALFSHKVTTESVQFKFKIGQEFDEKCPNGRDVKTIVTQEGDKFISMQTPKKYGEKPTKIIREFKGDKMIETSKCIGSNLVRTQVFKKQA